MDLSLLQVIDMAFPRPSAKSRRVKFASARKLDVPSNVLDISAARDHLKWTPAVNFDEGLRRTVAAISLKQSRPAAIAQQPVIWINFK